MPGSSLRQLCLSAALLLGACAGTPSMDAPVDPDWERRAELLRELQTWDFTGRIQVSDAEETHNSRIRWRQNGDNFIINLWGALNIGATEITGSPEQVTLQQARREPIISASPEAMIAEQIGYELPVANLLYWIKGIPVPGQAARPVFNEHRQILSLEQSGWQIEYLGYGNFGSATLPTRIRMEKPPLSLNLVRLSWTLEAGEPL